jgi:hypothetical protein
MTDQEIKPQISEDIRYNPLQNPCSQLELHGQFNE